MLTKPQVFYDDTHKQALGYQNPFYLKKAQWIKPTLYDGSAISKKNDVISVVDEEETLILEEESRSQMLAKQNDPISKEKKVNISSINYSKLNKLAKDFGKHFVPQKELSAEQASGYKFQTLTLNNLMFHIHLFDKVVKQMTPPKASPRVHGEKVFAIATLKNKLRKLKGKNVLENDFPMPNPNVLAPGMFKLDLEPLAHKVLKRRDAHIYYIKHSREHADTLREIVKNARALRPIDSNLDSAYDVL
ncbi:hypothetical protein Tco_0317367 [Tanacetum coccineum]